MEIVCCVPIDVRPVWGCSAYAYVRMYECAFYVCDGCSCETVGLCTILSSESVLVLTLIEALLDIFLAWGVGAFVFAFVVFFGSCAA